MFIDQTIRRWSTYYLVYMYKPPIYEFRTSHPSFALLLANGTTPNVMNLKHGAKPVPAER